MQVYTINSGALSYQNVQTFPHCKNFVVANHKYALLSKYYDQNSITVVKRGFILQEVPLTIIQLFICGDTNTYQLDVKLQNCHN